MARYEKVVVDNNSKDSANYFRQEEGGDPLYCVGCQHVLYYEPSEYAKGYGHVYSPTGIEEVRISGFCEYDYDKMFADEDEESDVTYDPTGEYPNDDHPGY